MVMYEGPRTGSGAGSGTDKPRHGTETDPRTGPIRVRDQPRDGSRGRRPKDQGIGLVKGPKAGSVARTVTGPVPWPREYRQ